MQHKIFIFLLGLFLIGALQSEARVRFITETENTAGAKIDEDYISSGNETFNNDAKQRCAREGFNLTKCSSGFFLASPCPHDYSYYAECCPSEYHYTSGQCQEQGKTVGAYSCGGYYKCQ